MVLELEFEFEPCDLEGNYAPFVHGIFAPLREIINVTLYVIMGHSSKDVTMDFIIREVLFTECFFPLTVNFVN